MPAILKSPSLARLTCNQILQCIYQKRMQQARRKRIANQILIGVSGTHLQICECVPLTPFLVALDNPIELQDVVSMAIRIVRLGSARFSDEGLRIGTVRHPPRGVSKDQFAAQNWYDVWFPTLSPETATVKLGQAAMSSSQWNTFVRRYRAEMARPEARHALNLLAALSHQCNFSVGCYCKDELRCHRSVLRELLAEAGAKLE